MSDGREAAASAGPPPVADIQDPLPESAWLWRRIFVFAVTAWILLLIGLQLDRLGDIAIVSPAEGIKAFIIIIRWLLFIVILMVTYYLVAPSAEQITKMIQTARALKEGVVFSGAAKVVKGDSSAETSATAGKPAPLDLTDDMRADDGELPESERIR